MRRFLAVLLFLFILTALNGNRPVVASGGDSDGVWGSPGDGQDVGGFRYTDGEVGRAQSTAAQPDRKRTLVANTAAVSHAPAFRTRGDGGDVGGVSLFSLSLTSLYFVQR